MSTQITRLVFWFSYYSKDQRSRRSTRRGQTSASKYFVLSSDNHEAFRHANKFEGIAELVYPSCDAQKHAILDAGVLRGYEGGRDALTVLISQIAVHLPCNEQNIIIMN